MEENLLVEALLSRDPGAPAAVYDAYAAGLYVYCWFRLLRQDVAQAALCDTFLVAEAQIGRLRAPADLRSWLYALARVECSRHTGLTDGRPDLVVARHDQDDADQRTVAWRSLQSLSAQARELLELRFRHRLPVRGLAAVLELPARRLKRELADAEEDLRLALAAEILARLGPHGCRGRGAILAERVAGELDSGVRAKLLSHAGGCDLCGKHLPSKAFSPAKVLELSPCAPPSVSLRARVMNCFTDPELQGYRLFVATRATEFTAAGFPAQSRGMSGSAGFFGMVGRNILSSRNMIA